MTLDPSAPIERRVRAALAIDDDDLARLLALGLSHLAAKQPREARALFLLVTRLEPEGFVGHLYLGLTALDAERPAEAVEHLHAAVALLEARTERTDAESEVLGEVALLLAMAQLQAGVRDAAELLVLRLAGAGLGVSADASRVLASMHTRRAG